MNHIIKIIKKYRKRNAHIILLKDSFKTLLFFLFLYYLFSFFELIYYLEPSIKIKIINFYLSTLSLTIVFIISKWIITVNSFFNYKNDLDVAKEIWDSNLHIKDRLLNVIQINKQESLNNDDLKKYALKNIETELEQYLKPNEIFYSRLFIS